MAKRKPIYVNGEMFETKKALQERVQAILWSYSDGDVLLWPDFLFVRDLLNRHQDAEQKIGCGIATLYVKRNPVYTQTRGFWLVRTDGTETDFSYLMCLRHETKLQQFRAACRVAIAPTVIEFKSQALGNGRVTCSYTGEALTYDNAHVDHEPPNTFEEIFRGFIAEHSLDVDTIAITGPRDDGIIQNRMADAELENAFIEYHNSRARLRVISQTANLSHVKREAA